MNKNIWIILTIILILIVGFSIFFFTKNNNKNTDNKDNNTVYEANRTSTNNIINTSTEKQTTNTYKNNLNTQNTSNINTNYSSKEKINTRKKLEEQIATFSTKIYSQDTSRQNNIEITCRALDGTTVKNGATFSFCNTVGPSTSNKGYQKADIFDNKGNKKKGLGGGNCQISSTLYNAVLSVPSLQVTERHAHSNKVPYVTKGKDAAVAYGSYDFKFINKTGKDIKIKAQTSKSNVTVSLISLTDE